MAEATVTKIVKLSVGLEGMLKIKARELSISQSEVIRIALINFCNSKNEDQEALFDED